MRAQCLCSKNDVILCARWGGEEELKKVPKPLHAYINAVLKHTTYFGFINEAA